MSPINPEGHQNLMVIAESVDAAMFPFGFHFVSAAPMRTR
jgi:hypothetical protein